MKIMAFSDSHGRVSLPVINDDIDVVCICGDIIPLPIQRNVEISILWLQGTFFRWVNESNVKKVFWIGGNHDFALESLGYNEINRLITDYGIDDRLVYLMDSSYEFEGKKFFGTPWVKDLRNWAFYSKDLNETFKCIEDCDVLLTHIPPQIDKVGCSNPYQLGEREFGSMALTKVFEDKKIGINFCGHIHTGVHNGVKYNNTTVYNVSLLDEDYNEAYKPTIIEI